MKKENIVFWHRVVRNGYIVASQLRELEIDKISKVAISSNDFKSEEDIPTPNEILALEVLIDFKEVDNE